MNTPIQPNRPEPNNRAARRRRAQGETRDSQSKRLTTTVWVDVTSTITYVVETLEPRRSDDAELNEFDKALDKMLWFSILHEGRCLLPLPHWKVMVGLTFRAMGGKVAVRRASPGVHDDLSRQDRWTNLGEQLRTIVHRRFDEGLGDA